MKRAPTVLRSIFAKFAGLEVAVTETVSQTRYGEIRVVKPNERDPNLRALFKAAKDAGYRVRLCTPGMKGTMDYREDRIKADLSKGPDGKYRISGLRIG